MMAVRFRSSALCMIAAAALCAMLAAGARAERVEWTSPLTLETSDGTVSCPATPANPDWAEVLWGLTPNKLTAEVLAAGTLHCTIPTYGEVELAAAGLPWRFVASVKQGTAHLKGTKKLTLEVTLVGVGAKCVYESGRVKGVLSGESPAVLSYSAPKVRLNTARSFFLCPAAGSFSGSIPLP